VNYSTVALAAILIVLSPVALAFGQGPMKTQPFGCEYYGDVMHCDLLLNDLQGYEVSGNSTLVHPVTNTETLFVDGKEGQALQMRGEYRESIEMMNTPDVNPEQFSVSFWIKSTEIQPYGHIVSHSNKHQTAGWQFDTFGTSGPNGEPVSTMRFGVFNTNGTLYSPAELTVPVDKFMHVVGTFDGNIIKVYRDGKLTGQTQFMGNYAEDPGVPIRIGSAAYCASCNRWSGMIDEVRMYNRTLNDQEVKQLDGLSDVSSGLVGNWKFNGNTEDVLGKNPGAGTTMVSSMQFAPDGRLFFDEKNTGEIRIMTRDGKILDKPLASVQDVYVSWEQGMLGLTLDPDFSTNHYVYVYYSALVDTQNDGGKVINRVLRFTEKNNVGTDMKVLLDNIPASRGFHSGGALAFGPDDKLYITVGDATEHIFAQDPSIVIGKVLRIDRDGAIPEDNPYPNSPVYTVGHRNMYGIAFGKDGTGVISENGDFHYDEINVIQKGGNYGFPTMQPPNLPPERANNSSIKPLRTYYDTIAPTQLIYYEGNAVPELQGMYLFGSFTGDIYAVRLSEDKKHIVEEIHVDLEHFPFVPTIAIAQSPDGKIYYGGYQIYTLDSIGTKSLSVFEVQIDSPAALNINNLVVQPEQKMIEIDSNTTNALGPDSTLTARIPKALLENVTTVAIEGRQGQLSSEDITMDDSNANYTSVTVKLGPVMAHNSVKMSISGVSATTVVPEFPAAMLMIAVVFVAVTAVAAYGKRKHMI
jgi:glucose/arabinose dehydrogenase